LAATDAETPPRAEPEAYVRAIDALKLYGVRDLPLFKAALFGRVRARLEPGQAPRFHEGDVIALAAERAARRK
jgi:hypothetical protein